MLPTVQFRGFIYCLLFRIVNIQLYETVTLHVSYFYETLVSHIRGKTQTEGV